MSRLKRVLPTRKPDNAIRHVGTDNQVRLSEAAHKQLKKLDQAKANLEGRAWRIQIG
jgi:hypothetical protein